jgi:hypothetical protein
MVAFTEDSVPEKSPSRCPRVGAERGQEFIRVGKSLPWPLRRSNIGFNNEAAAPEGIYLGKLA